MSFHSDHSLEFSITSLEQKSRTTANLNNTSTTIKTDMLRETGYLIKSNLIVIETAFNTSPFVDLSFYISHCNESTGGSSQWKMHTFLAM